MQNPLQEPWSLSSTAAWEGADGKTSRWAGLGIAGEGKGGAEIKATRYKWQVCSHMLKEREKTAKPSVTWQPGRMFMPRSWDTKIFQPVFCLKLCKGNAANKGCPCYMLNMMLKLPFPFLWVRQTVTTFVSMAPGLWSPAGGSHTSPLIFSLHTSACKHMTIHIHTNMHTWTHTCSQKQCSHLDSHACLRHLLPSQFWQLKPKNHLPSKMPGIKRGRMSWGWGGEE